MNLRKIFLIFIIALLSTGCGHTPSGEYAASVMLSGGSGRASVESPCTVTVQDNIAEALIKWSSPHYDYMIVNGEKYLPVNTEGNSEFRIPVELDKDMSVQADTVAMSEPHLIDYTLHFTLLKEGEDGSEGTSEAAGAGLSKNWDKEPPEIQGIEFLKTDENRYAECFLIHRYSDGYAVISVNDGRNYLIVPEGKEVPGDTEQKLIVIKKPVDHIYLAASGVMCQFDALDSVSNIILSGIEKDKWFIESAKEAMEKGEMEYGGKYSAPDYEKILMMNVDLVIENTMILHTPKVLDKLSELGLPVFIDRCNYESDPLGRCEWIRIYGLMTDREEEAEKALQTQIDLSERLKDTESYGKTVVVFSMNSDHMISTKKKNDYFSKMIEIAGGTYLYPDVDPGDSASSQVTVSTEAFYDYASDADIIIYNAAIEDAPKSLEALKNSDVTFADFKAIKEGNVYCTDRSLYQFAQKNGTIIDNLNKIISGEAEDTEFFHKLK